MTGGQQSTRKHYWLYVLTLRDGKYYVGITTKTPEVRYMEHKIGIRGAGWTQKHKPIAIFDRKDLGTVTRQQAERYENRVTRVYMDKYGYNNVRGGDLSNPSPLIDAGLWYFFKKDWKTIAQLLVIAAVILLLLVIDLFKRK